MVALALKILIATLLLMFFDLLISPFLPVSPSGMVGIPIGRGETVEYFTLITLLLRLFEILATFLVLIIHAITHILQPEVFNEDVNLLVDGLLALFFWLIGGFVDLLTHLFNLPFIIIGMLMPDRGLSAKFDVLNVIGVYVNFETMTFQLNVSPLPYDWDISKYFNLWFNLPVDLPSTGFNVQMKNVISLSLLPTRSGYDIGGTWISPYLTHNNGVGFAIEMLNFISTNPPAIGYVEIGINTGGLADKKTDPNNTKVEISINWIIDKAISMIAVKTPVRWMDEVYSTVIPAIGNPTYFLTEIQNFIKVRKCQLNQAV